MQPTALTVLSLLSACLLANCVVAQAPTFRNLSLRSLADGAVKPTPPLMPNQFTASFTEYIEPTGTDPYYANGYIYYDYDGKRTQTDVAYPGGVVSMMMDYASHHVTYDVLSATPAPQCSVVILPFPMAPPTMLSTFQFAGVATLNDGQLAYAWQGTVGPMDMTVFSSASNGSLLAEITPFGSIVFQSFTEGIPEGVFASKSACEAAIEDRHSDGFDLRAMRAHSTSSLLMGSV